MSQILFFNLDKSKNLNKEFLDNLFKSKEKINDFYSPVNLDDLPFPDWDDYVNLYPLRNDFLVLNKK